jgi:hypothetical protein
MAAVSARSGEARQHPCLPSWPPIRYVRNGQLRHWSCAKRQPTIERRSR